jgi:hypothetical protein
MGWRTESGRPVSSSQVQGRDFFLKADRRGPPLITKGYGGSLAVGLKHDPTARTHLPQRDGGRREREPEWRWSGGSPAVAGSGGVVSRRLRWSFSAALDQRHCKRRSGTPGMAGALGAPRRRCRARSGTRGEMVSSGR